MRNKLFLVSIPSFLIVVISIACKQEEEPESPKIAKEPISKSLGGFLFETNRYWIYDNGSSDDSMFIGSTVMRIQYYGSSHSGSTTIQEYDMDFISFFGYPSKKITAATNYLWFKFPGFFAGGDLFLMRSSAKDTLTYNHYRPCGMLPTFTVSGKDYSNVYVSEIDASESTNSGTFDRFYFKDSIGIIRQEHYQSGALSERHDLLRFSVKLHQLQ